MNMRSSSTYIKSIIHIESNCFEVYYQGGRMVYALTELSMWLFFQYWENGPGWNSTLWLISSQPWHMHMRSSSTYIKSIIHIESNCSEVYNQGSKVYASTELSIRLFFQYWENGPGWNSLDPWLSTLFRLYHHKCTCDHHQYISNTICI
jgi:phage-related protein